MSVIDYTDVQAYKDYVEDHSTKLIEDIFYGFESAKVATIHEGVKGKLSLQETYVGQVTKRYSEPFTPMPNQIKIVPQFLDVQDASIEVAVVPKRLEKTYHGFLRKTGQDPYDFPFMAFVIKSLGLKANQEFEIAFWKAILEPLVSQTDTDPLTKVYNGGLQRIADGVAATDITPIVTGSITNTNAVASVESVYAGMSTAFLAGQEVDMFMAPEVFDLYKLDYRERYGKYTAEKMADGRTSLGIGNANVTELPGLAGTQKIISTKKGTLNYGTDLIEDASMFNFENEVRTIKMWADFKCDMNFTYLQDGYFAVNDQ